MSTESHPSCRPCDGTDARARVLQAAKAMQEGTPVLLLDDAGRENEADVIIAAEKVTVETMALLIRECSGIVCLCLDHKQVERLQLPLMVENNETRFQTAFTVTIEARHGVTTGVSAADRVTTIRAAIAHGARPEDLARPGHVFPLRAVPGGVLHRPGHTEGSVDLSRIAGLRPAAVLCELMNPDGTMAKGDQVESFSQTHGFPILSIADIATFLKTSSETHDQDTSANAHGRAVAGSSSHAANCIS